MCATPGCINDQPCPTHTRKPWANVRERRPNDLTGRALQTRNRRILARDAHTCHVCGQPGANTVDHVIPQAHGGTEDDTNLAAIHATPCHTQKTQAESRKGRGLT